MTAQVSKTTKTPTSAAQIAMANRTRVSFGKAYIRDVLNGVQNDFDKQISHGVALGLGTRRSLRKMGLVNLRALLAKTLSESETTVPNAPCVH